MGLKHQKGNSRRASALDVVTRKGEVVAFKKTDTGELLYDLAFRSTSAERLARKWGLPVSEVKRLRELKSIKSLSDKVRKDKLQEGVR